jgi:pimeloyl-ACP methyl ester carboxylesterase
VRERIERVEESDLLDGISSREVSTPRLRTHLLAGGPDEGTPVLFVHGNVASSRFFEEILAALPPDYRGLAPDLRGFGKSEPKPVDAARGLRDLSDDLYGLTGALGYERDRKVHLVGWSLGGGVAMQYAIDHPEEVASLTLCCPVPPFGMGGTKTSPGRLAGRTTRDRPWDWSTRSLSVSSNGASGTIPMTRTTPARPAT